MNKKKILNVIKGRKGLILLTFLFYNVSYCRINQKTVTIELSENKIDILYNSKIVLSGGVPQFQSGINAFRNPIQERDKIIYSDSILPVEIKLKQANHSNVVAFFISPNGNQSTNGKDFVGVFFDQIPGFTSGVTMWRYKPWNSWTKPIRINNINQIEDWDIQFFYWQYSDGSYGAAMPLSGNGYRATIGKENGKFGVKAVSHFDRLQNNDIPLIAVGFSKDPYELFSNLFEDGLKLIGKEENFINHKKFPKILENIGWCTWNSSGMGKNLDENFLLDAAKNFSDAKFPLKYLIIDDGWFDQTNGKLNSFVPDKEKFPNGFSNVIAELKTEFGLADVGVWHALNGYWQGINPESELGLKYKSELFSWKEKENPAQENSSFRTCSFIRPNSESLNKFYSDFHSSLKQQGFSFLKVDNQLVTERMSVSNFPILDGAE
jgi:raffinose synthase